MLSFSHPSAQFRFQYIEALLWDSLSISGEINSILRLATYFLYYSMPILGIKFAFQQFVTDLVNVKIYTNLPVLVRNTVLPL